MTCLSILLANGILLVGLHAFDWSPATVALLFWCEAAAVGAFTLLKVGLSLPGEATGAAGPSVRYQRLPQPGKRTRVSSSVPRVNPWLALPLFVVFYGGLLAGYGGLLLLSLKNPDFRGVLREALAAPGVLLALAFIVGQQLSRWWSGYVWGPAWQRVEPTP